MTILLERDSQMARLRNLLGRAGGGRGHVAALLGEAGAGKTSLVEAFAAGIGEGTRIFRSACEDLSIPDPLGPLHDLARHARWSLPRGDEVANRERLPLFSEAIEIFDTPARPTLLVIEDLHWADDATLDFVRFVGRRIAGTRILLLITARNDDTEGQRLIRRALSDIPSHSIERIEVPLLTEAAVSTLARQSGRDGGEIYRATAGNAFFVAELLCAGNACHMPPPNVRDAVLARAERLPGGARQVLDAVSVFPRRADGSILADLCGAGSDVHLAACVANGILDHVADTFAFRHDIARRAIELAMPAPIRRALNAKALAALRDRRDVPTARLAHHAIEANDLEAVRDLAPKAAREAADLGAHREAAGHYRAALEQAGNFPLGERAVLYEKHAFECHLIGQIPDAIAAQREALTLHEIRGDGLRQGDCLRWLSRLSYLLGDRDAADAYGGQAVVHLEREGRSAELAMAYSNLAHLAMLAEDIEGALAQGEKAVGLAEALDRPDIVCHALNNAGTAGHWLDPHQARVHLDRSLEIALEQNLQEHAARAFTNRSCVEIQQLDYRRARSFLHAGIDYCVERDLDTWQFYMRGWLAELLLRRGEWEKAADEALQVVTNDRVSPLLRYPAVMALARLRTRRGDPACEPLLAELSRFLERGMEFQRLAPYAALMAERAWLGQGDRDEALDLIARAEAMATKRTMVSELAFWRHMLTPQADPGDTGELARPYRQFFRGDWRGAATIWDGLDAPYEQALMLLAGDDEARRAALAIFDRLGAGPASRHLRGEMQETGVLRLTRGPYRAARSNHAGLTRREMQVLELIDRGLSNKGIARHLSISPKTVDHHVSAVLGKLDSGTRGKAAAIARESGLIERIYS